MLILNILVLCIMIMVCIIGDILSLIWELKYTKDRAVSLIFLYKEYSKPQIKLNWNKEFIINLES